MTAPIVSWKSRNSPERPAMIIIGVYLAYFRATVRTRVNDERGASFIEYALLTSLIAVACLLAVNFIGMTTNESLSSTGSMIDRP